MPRAIGSVGWRRSHRERERPSVARPGVVDAAAETRWAIATRLTYLLIALYAITFATLSIRNHESFGTHAFDLGNMDQAVWNTYQGRLFEFTNWEGGRTRLAAHVEPILLAIAQLYRIHSGPETLLVLQSVVLAAGALPAFWLARRALGNEFAALAFAAVYLLSPALEAANLADFHPVALGSTFLMASVYFLVERRYAWFMLFAVLAMSTKEQVPLSITLMGLYITFVQRRAAVGWPVTALAIIWFVIAFAIVIPTNNPTGASPYLSRYDHLGSGPRELLLGLIQDPQRVVHLLSEPARQAYLRGLLYPVAYLPVLSPLVALFALPDLAINTLSNFEWMYSGEAHYGSAIAPILVAAAILGAGRICHWVGRLHSKAFPIAVYLFSGAALVSSVWSYWNVVFLPLRDHLPTVTEHNLLASEALNGIPPNAAVSTGSTLNPHLSQRERLYLFPDLRDADFVALDVSASPYPIDWPSQRWRVEGLISRGWGIQAAKDGYLILRRGLAQETLPDEFFTFARAASPPERPSATVQFGERVDLVGWDWHPKGTAHGRQPGEQVDTFWRVQRPLEENLVFQFEVVSAEGRVMEAVTATPTTVWYPTSLWRPGEIVRILLDRLRVDGDGTVAVRVSRQEDEASPKVPLKPVAIVGSGVELRGDAVKLFEFRAAPRP